MKRLFMLATLFGSLLASQSCSCRMNEETSSISSVTSNSISSMTSSEDVSLSNSEETSLSEEVSGNENLSDNTGLSIDLM